MKAIRYVAVLGILLVVLVGCSSNRDSDDHSAPALYPPESAPGADDASGDSTTLMNADANFRVWSDGGNATIQNVEPMIVKSGSLSLTVEDTDAALAQITDIATEYGGYVIRSNSNRTGTYDTAGITIAVRAENFETAMAALQQVGLDVNSVSTEGQDVTAEYVDLESRLRNLEATRDRLLSFLNDAQNAEEAILVNDRLTGIEGEIEQVKGRMNYLSGRATFSTITIDLREPNEPQEDEDGGWSPGSTITSAINAQGALVQILVNVVIWLTVVAGPYALIAGVVVVGWRRWFKRPTEPVEDTSIAE